MARIKDIIESVELTGMTDPKQSKVWIDGKIDGVVFRATMVAQKVVSVFLHGNGWTMPLVGRRIPGFRDVQRLYGEYFRSEWFLEAVGAFWFCKSIEGKVE